MDPQLQQRLMIFGGLVPGTISILLLLGIWYLHSRKQSQIDKLESGEKCASSVGPRWMLPLMLGLGFAGADYAANYTIHLWPDGNNYRFTHAIILIAIVGIVEGIFALPILAALALRFFAYAGAFWMLAEGYIQMVFGNMPTFVGSTLFAAMACSLIATASDRLCEDNASQNKKAWVDIITWLVIAAASMLILLKNSFSIGAMIPAGIIAVLTSALIISLLFRSLCIARGGVTVLIGFLFTMLIGSIIQTGTEHLPSLLLLALAPMVTLVPLKTPSGLRFLLARMILLVIILGSSVGTIYWSQNADQQGSDEVDPYADYDIGS